MQTITKISLEKLFPQDDYYWRVVWVDGLISKFYEKEPQLRVFLTRLKSGLAARDNPLNSYNSDRSQAAHATINVGVGHQNLIYIGSVWHRGHDVSSRFHYDIFNFELDTTKAKPITLSEKNDQGKRILPPQQYPIGSAFQYIKDSNLIALEYMGQEDGFLIPVSEIIRFYYLITTSMSLSVHYGRFSDLIMGTPIIDAKNRSVEFTLNWGVSERNVITIARYLVSQLTKNRIDEVHNFAQINSLNNAEARTNYRFFPFEGHTKISCEGLEIIGDDKVKRFLCTRLISCTGDMGFDSVVATRMVSSLLRKDLDEETRNSPYMWPLYADAPISQITLDEEPSKSHVSKTFATQEERHPNLANIGVTIIKKQYQSDRNKNVVSDGSSGDRNISTSEGTYGESNARKAHIEYIVLAEDFIAPPRLQTFINCLNHLRQSGWNVKTRTVTVPDKYLVKDNHEKIATFKLGDDTLLGLFNAGVLAKSKSWAETPVDNQIRQRGIVIAEVTYLGHVWYLFELEPNKNDLDNEEKGFSLLIRYVKSKDVLTNEVLYEFMRKCVENSGWPKLSTEEATKFKEAKLNHTSGLADRLKIKMQKQMEN